MPPKTYNRVMRPNGDIWDDWDNEVMNETKIFKESLIKVKTTKEYSFGTIKLVHYQDENTGKESFRLFARNDNEISADEAKILANVIKDIYNEEDEDNGKTRGHQTREGNSDS